MCINFNIQMKTIIYIENKLCLTYDKLKNCFLSVTSINDDAYWDLLDYGKNKELPKFLSELGELQVAEELDLIDVELEDSQYFFKMASAILGEETANLKLGSFNVKENPTISTSKGYTTFSRKLSETLRRNCAEVLANMKVVTENVQKEIAEMKNLNSLEFNVGNNDFRMVQIPFKGNDGDFYIGQVPVTQGLWKAVMGNEDECFQRLKSYTSLPDNYKSWMTSQHLIPYKASLLGDDKPMTMVEIHNVLEFIKKLNKFTGEKFRLPTAEEWFLAANAYNESGYSQSKKNEKLIQDYSWYAENSDTILHNVAETLPNDFGVYDLYGNVWEMVLDKTIMLGGSFTTSLDEIWATKRSMSPYYDVGFRLMLKGKGEDEIADNVEFVDLGLSVLWSRNNEYYYEGYFEGPTQEEVKELLQLCDINEIDDYIYRITGPNGNYIFVSCGWYRIESGRHHNSSIAVNFILHQINDVYDKHINYKLRIKRR